jgi:hypothetical protein
LSFALEVKGHNEWHGAKVTLLCLVPLEASACLFPASGDSLHSLAYGDQCCILTAPSLTCSFLPPSQDIVTSLGPDNPSGPHFCT